jgi:non-ribosomal peptide synthetase component F
MTQSSLGVTELFQEHAERTPDAVAVVFEDESLTYGELNKRANQLGRYLIGLGVGPEDVVALAVPQSVEMVIALLGILKAGAAYLPLDSEYPDERLRFMVEDAGPVVLLTTSEMASRLPRSCPCVAIDSPETRQALMGSTASNPGNSERLHPFRLQNPAYVMYTSGSTGTPKGVVITNAAIVRLVFQAGYVEVTPQDRIAQVANAAFDAVTFEIWGALLNGAAVVLIDKETALNPVALHRRLQSEKVTIIF